MKILIVSSVFPNTIANMYDEAMIQYNLGNDVTVLDCDSSIGICWHNPTHNRNRCKFCEKYRKKLSIRMPDGIKFLKIRQFLKRDVDIEKNYSYYTIKDIKSLMYKNVNIGLCCLSIYISVTRNSSPLIDDKFKSYFNILLSRVTEYINALELIFENEKPDNNLVRLLIFKN